MWRSLDSNRDLLHYNSTIYGGVHFHLRLEASTNFATSPCLPVPRLVQDF